MKKASIISTLAISTMLLGGVTTVTAYILPVQDASAKAVQKQLIPGSYTVGPDLNPGRYVITSTGGSGNLSSTPKKTLTGDAINEVLGSDDPTIEVSQVTATLAKGDKIQVSGMTAASFAPAPTGNKKNNSSLSTGFWTVGKDIKPGKYVVTPAQGQSGNFVVHPKHLLDNETNEVLGDDTSMDQVPKVKVNLHKGDQISIEGMNSVNFAK